MTTKQIAEKINSVENEYWMGCNFDFATAKVWQANGFERIYIGNDFIEIKSGKATVAPYVTRKRDNETNQMFEVRKEANEKMYLPLDVLCRYANILLKK